MLKTVYNYFNGQNLGTIFRATGEGVLTSGHSGKMGVEIEEKDCGI